MRRITDKDLIAVVARLNRTTGHPEQSYDPNGEPGNRYNVGSYYLSYAYGGVALCRVVNQDGGSEDVLRSGHIPRRDLYNQVHAYLKGWFDAFDAL